MADQNLDGGQNTGVQGTPTPDASQGSGDERGSSFDAATMQAGLETLTKNVEGLSKAVSTMQSGKDRAVVDVKKEVGELKTLLGDYEQLKERLGPEGAIEQLELKQQLSDIQAQLAGLGNQPSAQSVGNSDSGATDVAKAISKVQEYGLDANDPGFLDVLKQGANESAVEKYILNKVKPQPAASTAGAVAEPARGGAPKENVDALMQEYIKKVLDAHGKKGVIMALKREYAEKGVPVNSANFSV